MSAVKTKKPPARKPRKGLQRGGKPAQKKAEVKRFDFASLRWNSSPATRKSLERLLTAYLTTGEVTEGQLRVCTYTGRALLPFFEFERGLALDDRLDALEARVEEVLKEARREP